MNVLRAHVFQIDTVDFRRHFHVVLHARYGLDVADAVGNLEQTASVVYPEVLHGLCDGEADGRAPARFVGNDQARSEGVESAVDALDAGVKRLKVDADIGVTLVPHASSHQTHVLIEYMFDNTRSSGHRQNLPKRDWFVLVGMVVRLHRGFNAALKSAKQPGKPRFVA